MGAARRLDAFHAVADPSRRRILELVRDGERTAGDLAGRFAFSWPALSQHLRILRTARLIRARREGRHIWYRADPGALDRDCGEWVRRYTAYWREKLGDLKSYVESEQGRAGRRIGGSAKRRWEGKRRVRRGGA